MGQGRCDEGGEIKAREGECCASHGHFHLLLLVRWAAIAPVRRWLPLWAIPPAIGCPGRCAEACEMEWEHPATAAESQRDETE